ncbi:MAG: hypothetical protein IJM37_04685 [Lachnospiraceae bacterium]|nr:hypothetical protein [Lachnospiraceae bacterium]
MNEDTIKLLRECNSGCKSATNSIEQVMPYTKDEGLIELLNKYNEKHIHVGDSCHNILNSAGEDEKDPPAFVQAMAQFGTEMKLMINDDTSKIAELMVDGCNMGIKSLSRYLHQYKAADSESIHLTEKLIKIEEDFMHELLAYL